MGPIPDPDCISLGAAGEVTALAPIAAKSRPATAEPRWRIELDGQPWAELEAETVVRFGLKRGRRLTLEERQSVLMADQVLLARRWAAARCSLRPRTRRAMARELGEKRYTPAVIETALAALEQAGILNDAEVARRHLRKRARAGGYGPARLLNELINLGVERSVADAVLGEAVNEADPDERCREAAEGWIKRRGRPEDSNQRARLIQFLQRRGFDGETIRQAIERDWAPEAE
jgi:regulatory protein